MPRLDVRAASQFPEKNDSPAADTIRVMRRLPIVMLLVIGLTGCGRDAALELTEPPRMVLDRAIPAAPTSTTAQPVYTQKREAFGGLSTATIPPNTTLVAMSVGDTDIFETADGPAPMMTLPHTTILGTVSVFEVVEGPVDGWVKVKVPVRPNGTQGWVEATDLMMYRVDGRFVIDLSERQLTYFEDGEMVLTTPVAVGSKRNPTPEGDFFVTDNVSLADPGSAWGPHAFGISARSDTITEYNGGDGIIGIHGTNRPGSIGNAASLGCIRVPNEVITRLHEMVPIGTPVEIIA